jgi:hypothetical protein
MTTPLFEAVGRRVWVISFFLTNTESDARKTAFSLQGTVSKRVKNQERGIGA